MAEVGGEVWVLDGGIPYPCRVVDKRGGKLEQIFKNWNARHDLWLDEDSPRIVDCPGEVVASDSQVSVRAADVKNKRDFDYDPDGADVGCPLGYNLRKRPSVVADDVVRVETPPKTRCVFGGVFWRGPSCWRLDCATTSECSSG